MVIPFDPHRFRAAAAAYTARVAYSPRLFERIALLCKLDRRHRMLDLGCGPGPIAIALAPYVGHAIGVDPEPEMLERAAAAVGGDTVEWIEGSSYDLDALAERLGRLRLCAMGRSFHWMDRDATLVALDRIIEPGGAVALLHDEHPGVPANLWHVQFRAIIDRYTATDPSKQLRNGAAWRSHEAVLLDSPFHALETIAITETRRVSIDTLLTRTRSMSTVALHAAELADELRAAVAPFAAADATLPEVVSTYALLARRV